MAIQGLRDTEAFLAAARPQNWRQGIMLFDPNGMSPLLALTSLMKQKATDDPAFHWFEKELAAQRIQMAEDLDNVETAITVTSGALQLKVGHILLVEESGELLLVTQDPTVDTLIPVVTRSFGDVAATAVAALTGASVNDRLLVVGNVYEEGSQAPSGIAYDPTDYFNYTQIFRDTLQITNTAARTNLRTGDAVREARREAAQYHGIGMERSLIFGERALTTLGGNAARTQGGILWQLTQRNSASIKDAAADHGAGVQWQHIEDYLEECFRWGPSEKIGFCGNGALLTIQRAIRNAHGASVEMVQGQKEFGMTFNRLVTSFGEVMLKTHPLFNHAPGGVPAGGGVYHSLSNWLMILDQSALVYRYLRGRDTKFEGNLQQNGEDAMKSGFLTEMGLELHNAKSFMVIKNLHTFAAEA